MYATGLWTVKVRKPGRSWQVIRQGKNIITNFGLNAWANELGGTYIPPGFLALNAKNTSLVASYGVGVSSIATAAPAHVLGDTQLYLGLSAGNREVVTFVTATGAGPTTYALATPTTLTHALGDLVCRQVQATDTLASILTPVPYDSVYDPGHWPPATGSFQSGPGQYTLQFYLNLGQATSYIATAGLIDTQNIAGPGNLHNHFTVGYDNSAGISDMEIDSVITFGNG